MAHETHHETSHSTEKKSKTSMSASFWFVLILAGLFIAAVNFVNVTGNEHEEGEKTEQMHEAHSEAAAAEQPATEKSNTAETHGEAAQTTADTAAAPAEHH